MSTLTTYGSLEADMALLVTPTDEEGNLLERIHPEPQAHFVRLSRKQVKDLLSTQVRNRYVTRLTVECYARQMKTGMWVMDGAPIRCDWFGRVMDGQHRLHGFLLSGKRWFHCLLVIGLDPVTFKSMDNGPPRSATNVAQIMGIEQAKYLAAVARQGLLWEDTQTDLEWTDKYLFRRARFGNLEVMSYAEEHGELTACVDHSKVIKDVISRSLGGHLIHRMFLAGVPEDAVLEFLSLVRDPSQLSTDHPIAVARSVIFRIYEQSRRYCGRIDHRMIFIVLLAAWNRYRKGSRGMKSPSVYERLRTKRIIEPVVV